VPVYKFKPIVHIRKETVSFFKACRVAFFDMEKDEREQPTAYMRSKALHSFVDFDGASKRTHTCFIETKT
jgi:hypothetical protein